MCVMVHDLFGTFIVDGKLELEPGGVFGVQSL